MQKDLFKDLRPEEVETVEPVAVSQTQPSFFERVRIVLTLDKIIFWGLLNITAIVFIYSAGIEHGMKVSRHAASPEAQVLETKVSESVPASPEPVVSLSEPQAADPTVQKAREETPAEMMTGNFTIQLATYRRKDQAKVEVIRLSKKGHKAFIIPSGKFFQVCIEKFEKRPDAFRKLIEFKLDSFGRPYQGAYVRSVKNS